MKYLSSFSLRLLPFLLITSGCSVFGPIGDAISDGYENTVAYFNSYYNASRAFDEAELEILEAQRALGIRGFAEHIPSISAPSRQKLNLAIDKCSNILAFHASSNIVDDALFLVGKAYYYQSEYVKAERKFTEFLSRYPDAPELRDVEIWYLQTLARVGKDDEARALGGTLIEQTAKDGDKETEAHCYDVLGMLDARTQAHDKALSSYQHIITLTSEDEFHGWALYRIGQELSALGRFQEAAEAYNQVGQFSKDRRIAFLSKLEEIRSIRAALQNDAAVRRCEELLEDYRFVDKRKDILLERGLSYLEVGSMDRAENDLVEVDTTSGRSELASRAAFALAEMYETVGEDYAKARRYYEKSLVFPVASIAQAARKKQDAFGRYFFLRKERDRLDSLLTMTNRSDQDSVLSDSLRAPAPALDADSLRSRLTDNGYDLAEVFYVDLEQADSAVSWYRSSLKMIDDSVRTPRILYILAELSQSHPSRSYAVPSELFHKVIDSYPKSVYAVRSKIQLGLPIEKKEADEGEMLYRLAETKIDSGRFDFAVEVLKRIVVEHSSSPFAAKSAYTMGWLYENRLAQPDSAIKQYDLLLQSYGSSPYAAKIRPRLRAAKASQLDSTAALPAQRRIER